MIFGSRKLAGIAINFFKNFSDKKWEKLLLNF